jgi:hypothetical protein
VFNSAGVVIDMGRKRRLSTGADRDAARLMSTCCDFPGCDIPGEHTQIDHLDEYGRHNGNTDIDNAGLGCGSHNRTKTRKHYTAKRHTNGRVIYYRRDGTPMLAVGRRHPDQLPEPAETDDQMLTRLARARVAALRPAA